MRLSTWDLHNISKCPRRWFEKPPEHPEEKSNVREMMKRIMFSEEINKGTKWDFKKISKIWDEVYWKDKEINQKSINASVGGILATKNLFDTAMNLLGQEEYQIYSVKEISTFVTAGTEITSMGDFIISYSDKIETWIYGKFPQKEIRRSVIPSAEHYLVQSKVIGELRKPFLLVFYKATERGLNPTRRVIRSDFPRTGNEKLVMNLVNIAEKKISTALYCDLCRGCSLDC